MFTLHEDNIWHSQDSPMIAPNNLKWNLIKMLHVITYNRRYKLTTILIYLWSGNVRGIAKIHPPANNSILKKTVKVKYEEKPMPQKLFKYFQMDFIPMHL